MSTSDKQEFGPKLKKMAKRMLSANERVEAEEPEWDPLEYRMGLAVEKYFERDDMETPKPVRLTVVKEPA